MAVTLIWLVPPEFPGVMRLNANVVKALVVKKPTVSVLAVVADKVALG